VSGQALLPLPTGGLPRPWLVPAPPCLQPIGSLPCRRRCATCEINMLVQCTLTAEITSAMSDSVAAAHAVSNISQHENMTCHAPRTGVCAAPAAWGTFVRVRPAQHAIRATCCRTAAAQRHCGCDCHRTRRRRCAPAANMSTQSHCDGHGTSRVGTKHETSRPKRTHAHVAEAHGEYAALCKCPTAGAAQPIGDRRQTGAERPPAFDAGSSGDRAAALAAELQCNQDAMAGAAAERRQVLLHISFAP